MLRPTGSPAISADREKSRLSSTLPYRPAVMAEKISAARAPSAGEKRFCRVVLAWVSASIARAMASYSVCSDDSCSRFCAS